MEKDKTGVQLNLGHTSTDDFITKKYVLPLLRDEKMRNKLIEEHRACPVGKAAQPHKGQPMVEHSKELQIVLDKLRRQPMAVKKYVTVCKKDFEDYRIGIVTGVRDLIRYLNRHTPCKSIQGANKKMIRRNKCMIYNKLKLYLK